MRVLAHLFIAVALGCLCIVPGLLVAPWVGFLLAGVALGLYGLIFVEVDG